MQGSEIILPSKRQLEKMDGQELAVHVQGQLMELGMGGDYIAGTIKDLIENSYILTNSGEKYRDNKTVLESLKLLLKMYGIKGVSDGPQIAIFNGVAKDENGKLKF